MGMTFQSNGFVRDCRVAHRDSGWSVAQLVSLHVQLLTPASA